ncbi:type IIG restriction enzyme/methyltransferase [Companilactobacillus hulinensis]
MDSGNLLNLKQAINKNVKAMMPLNEQKVEFERNLNGYLSQLIHNDKSSEEFQKNQFRDFLKSTNIDEYINTSGRIDLAIYNGVSTDSSVGVIVEYKSLTNMSEMMKEEDLNVKSFRELVAYYLRERLIDNNLEVKRGIITNGLSFFVIDSKELEKHFIKNKRLVENFKKFENKQLSGSTTDFLYNEVIAPEIDRALKSGIKIAHFDLRDLMVKGTSEISKNKITQLYRFFSRENLLNDEIFTDANKLNKGFYDELLYIMGLQESKTSGNKYISRLPESKREPASLVENTIEQLDILGTDKSNQFDEAMQLTVVWVNRILFLKLLESSLVSFNESDEYDFLNYNKCHSFNDLNDLFFAVMAKKYDERIERLKEAFPHVPYMNSSLFEPSGLESSKNGVSINSLREADIKVYSKTKLKDKNGKRLSGKLSILDYLFKFLDVYDFT